MATNPVTPPVHTRATLQDKFDEIVREIAGLGWNTIQKFDPTTPDVEGRDVDTATAVFSRNGEHAVVSVSKHLDVFWTLGWITDKDDVTRRIYEGSFSAAKVIEALR